MNFLRDIFSNWQQNFWKFYQILWRCDREKLAENSVAEKTNKGKTMNKQFNVKSKITDNWKYAGARIGGDPDTNGRVYWRARYYDGPDLQWGDDPPPPHKGVIAEYSGINLQVMVYLYI